MRQHPPSAPSPAPRLVRSIRLGTAVAVLAGAATIAAAAIGTRAAVAAPSATSVDIVGPAGSQLFGSDVKVLTNGNFVVVDHYYDLSATRTDVGEVSLYSGVTHQLISMTTGSTKDDHVGRDGVFEVGDSNFVIVSGEWDNNGVADAGAVTWVNGTTGLNGPVSEANSLFGTHVADQSSGARITVLADGDYVASTPYWDDGAVSNVGAVTWADGNTGVFGAISAATSIHGTSAQDAVGSGGPNGPVVALPDGDYVVVSPQWKNGSIAFASAVTWANGDGTTVGAVSATNSLVGTSIGDELGSTGSANYPGIVPLANGKYVVASRSWTNPIGPVTDVGAVTLANGDGTTVGPVTPANSLVGTLQNDLIGSYGIITLTGNSNYVVVSPNRYADALTDNAGAVTWGSGVSGVVGPVTASNSLLGEKQLDLIGTGGIVPLTNGNYVVVSPSWDDPAGGVSDAGAVTFRLGDGSGVNGLLGGKSLIGAFTSDQVGERVIALTNGNYAVGSSQWGPTDVGAVTFGNGTSGTSGAVSTGNSLYGTSANDHVGKVLVPLSNGNYVAASEDWDDGATTNAGAATWLTGSAPTGSPVDTANSLTGTHIDDKIGTFVTPLTNGNYVVSSFGWTNGTADNAGAVTWANGATGLTGAVSTANSLFGTAANDSVGFAAPLPNGNYVVQSPLWNNGSAPGAGAVTLGQGATGTFGAVGVGNSLVGTQANDTVGEQIQMVGAGGYVLFNQYWDGVAADSGAVTIAGQRGLTGTIGTTNSFLGLAAMDIAGVLPTPVADGSIVVKRPSHQTVTLLRPPGAEFSGATNLDVTAASGASSASVAFATTAVDAFGAAVPVICDPASGATFPIGTTTVHCSATTIDGITSTTSFTVTVHAGVGGPGGAPDYLPLPPARLADTRPTGTTVDGLFAGSGQIAGGTTLELKVSGRGGVPADAVAATLNVTVTEAAAAGFVTAYPCGSEQPTASNLNYDVGATVPNAVVTKIGTNGAVCVFASQTVHLVVDVNGAFPPSTTYHAGNPARVLDTRADHPTFDGQQQGGGAVPAGTVTTLQITGRAGVPADASSVVLNVTVTEPAAAGYATVYPCGGEPPLASNLNFTPGLTIPNLVIAKIGAGGAVCIFNQSATHLVADVDGYFPATTSFAALTPSRVLDTRVGFATVDGLFAGAGIQPVGTVTTVHVAGRGGVPANAATAVLNVTVTDPAAAGYITVYPCGIEPPLASNLNFVASQTIPNAVLTKIGTNGDVCILNSQPANLIADVTGYFP